MCTYVMRNERIFSDAISSARYCHFMSEIKSDIYAHVNSKLLPSTSKLRRGEIWFYSRFALKRFIIYNLTPEIVGWYKIYSWLISPRRSDIFLRIDRYSSDCTVGDNSFTSVLAQIGVSLVELFAVLSGINLSLGSPLLPLAPSLVLKYLDRGVSES